MILKRLALIFLSLSLVGCFSNGYRYTNYPPNHFIAQNNRAVNSISQQLLAKRKVAWGSMSPLVIATVVNMDDLSKTSQFGRLLTEHVAARFAQLHYNIVELKLDKAVMMKTEQGEYVLTHDVQKVVDSAKAKGVVIGTYAENMNDVYINLKVVDPTNSVIIGAHSYALPKAPNILDMLSQ